MLKFKEGLTAKSGKTTKALQKVGELCLSGKNVLFINNEITFRKATERLEELFSDSDITKITNNFYFTSSNIGYVIEDIISDDILKDASIVVDIEEDVSDLKCEQDLYVYYQIPMR